MNIADITPKPRIFAHRGSTILAPENTEAAFDLAIDHQSDVLETDVRLSKDGVVIVTHDETLERTTNGTGRVIDWTLPELKELDAGYRFRSIHGETFTRGTLRLITLQELIQRYPNVGINIDIKDKTLAAAEAVAHVLKQTSHTQWLNVGSFHANVMQHFRRLAPTISSAATRQEVARLFFGGRLPHQPGYQILQIPVTYCGIKLTGKRFINKVHNLGCEVAYWTINDEIQMRRLIENGCNGIVSDRPDLALKVFQEFGIK